LESYSDSIAYSAVPLGQFETIASPVAAVLNFAVAQDRGSGEFSRLGFEAAGFAGQLVPHDKQLGFLKFCIAIQCCWAEMAIMIAVPVPAGSSDLLFMQTNGLTADTSF